MDKEITRVHALATTGEESSNRQEAQKGEAMNLFSSSFDSEAKPHGSKAAHPY